MKKLIFAGLTLAAAVLNAIPGGAVERHGARGSLASDNAVAYQLNPGHSGSITLSSGFAAPLKESWSKSLGILGDYFLIADGLVFITGVSDSKATLYALDVDTGHTVWSKEAPGTYLAYDNGTLFAQSAGGHLAALDPATGDQHWQIQLPFASEFNAYPLAADGRIYTSGDESGGYLYSVNEADGAIEWTLQGLDTGDSSPAYGDKGIYVAYPCQYFKFDSKRGKLKWHDDNSCHGGGAIVPALFGKRVYVADIDKGNFVLDAKTGRSLDTFNGFSNPTLFTPAKGGDMGVAQTSDGLECWKLATGQIAWNFAGDGQLSTSPIAVNGQVIVGSNLGMLYVLDSKKGKIQWSVNTGLFQLNSLVAGQGILVVAGSNSTGVGTITAYVPQ